jgi:uncharacterized protein (DUF849 family)
MKKTIITCAITGAATKPDQTPYLPITPNEIANSGLEAAEAGASILHIHVRNPENGLPSMDIDLYSETVDLIKKHNKKVLINLTTGPGALYIPESNDLSIAAKGTNLKGPTLRVSHITKIKPDLCSIDFNTMHQGNGGIRINHIKVITEMIKQVQSIGTKPELELFDSGDFEIAKELFDQGIIEGNPFWQFAMGIKYGWNSTPASINYAKTLLPSSSNWSAFGIGKMQMPFVALSMLHGGHVRVGMEDNIYIQKGILAKTNSELVKSAVEIIKLLGGDIADPVETKEILF